VVRIFFRINASEPRLLPEQQAARLAAAVVSAIAPYSCGLMRSAQVHRVEQAASACLFDRIAGLVSPFVDGESLIAEPQHFRHKRERIQTPMLVQGSENFFSAANLHRIADPEP
jgi:hypothetical protein